MSQWQKPIVITVTGGRDYDDEATVDLVLSTVIEHWMTKYPDKRVFVVQGGAEGLDLAVQEWCLRSGIAMANIPAEWNRYEKHQAGGMRNQQMLDWFVPTQVLAFPGGTGTADMTERVKTLIIQQKAEGRVESQITKLALVSADGEVEDWRPGAKPAAVTYDDVEDMI